MIDAPPSIFKYKFSPEKRQLLIETVLKEKDGKKISDIEVDRFIHVCEVTGLDPFLNQIYPNWRWNSDYGRNEVVGYQTGIDGLRLTAERSGKYRGQTKPEWCGTDGKWVDVWVSTEYPTAARIGVKKDGFDEPVYAVAKWDSYVPKLKNNKTGEFFIGPMWKKMPDNQLVKCAEAAALRKTFPQETMGLYVKEEMEQAEADHQNSSDEPEKKSEKATPEKQSSKNAAPPDVAAPKAKDPETPKPEAPPKPKESKEEKEMASLEDTNQFNAFSARMNKEGVSIDFVLKALKQAKMIKEDVADLTDVPMIVMRKVFKPSWTDALIEKFKNEKEPKNEPATAAAN